MFVMKMEGRAKNGCEEHMPYNYQTMDQLYSLLYDKSTQINDLKLRSMNASRALGRFARVVDDYKRFVMAVGSGSYSRLQALVARGLRSGWSVSAILTQMDNAVKGCYKAKSYLEIDYQRALILYRFGGARLADFAHRALGLPSLTTAREHSTSVPLRVSASYPTSDEVTANFHSVFPKKDHPAVSSDVVTGYSVSLDDIALQKRLRWDPTSNKIAGICREHGGACSLEFCSMHEANELHSALESNRVHFASEVCNSTLL
jgi:hypothetical protein